MASSGNVTIEVGGGADKLNRLGLTSVSTKDVDGDGALDLQFSARFLTDYTVTISDQYRDPLAEVELDLDGDGTTETFALAFDPDASGSTKDTMVVGTSSNDNLIGSDFSDILLGDDGDDILFGGEMVLISSQGAQAMIPWLAVWAAM